jgi:hypothetical protein
MKIVDAMYESALRDGEQISLTPNGFGRHEESVPSGIEDTHLCTELTEKGAI